MHRKNTDEETFPVALQQQEKISSVLLKICYTEVKEWSEEGSDTNEWKKI